MWDALRSDRPYRQALPEAVCVQHIAEQSGKLYDPEVVAAFLDLLDADSATTVSAALPSLPAPQGESSAN